jgi:hypothetical protein
MLTALRHERLYKTLDGKMTRKTHSPLRMSDWSMKKKSIFGYSQLSLFSKIKSSAKCWRIDDV